MDRRSTLAKMMGKTMASAAPTAKPKDPVLAVGAGLEPYQGPWTIREAGHLLRRATFGPTQKMINDAVSDGLAETVRKLLTDVAPPSPPLKYALDRRDPMNPDRRFIVNDPEVNYGETWVDANIFPNTGDPQLDGQILNYRQASIKAWQIQLMHEEKISIREKMAIFWHNHFVTADIEIGQANYQYISLIYDNVLGNFRELTKAMTINPSMLAYLNGRENVVQAPNENFARELLELFTIGKGDQVAPGDYTNYTEDDIKEMARVMTGWTIDPARLGGSEFSPVFYFFNHDVGTKQLSHRFGDKVIRNGGDKEYQTLIDIIFEQDECSRFICRKLYRYFIHYNITDDIEADVIEPMAQMVRDNDYNIEPAIEALLLSDHFYGEDSIGCMLKNPCDFFLALSQGLNIRRNPADVYGDYDYCNILFLISAEGGMDIFSHPSVAGWKAYYQEPQYYREWINTATLPGRTAFTTAFTRGGNVTLLGNDYNIGPFVPVLEFAASIPNSEDPNILIEALSNWMFPYGLTQNQRDFMKNILLGGLPDFEWTVEYTDYLADPGNPQKREGVENKLRLLMSRMLDMPEAQLM